MAILTLSQYNLSKIIVHLIFLVDEIFLQLQDWNNRKQFTSSSDFQADTVNEYFISQVTTTLQFRLMFVTCQHCESFVSFLIILSKLSPTITDIVFLSPGHNGRYESQLHTDASSFPDSVYKQSQNIHSEWLLGYVYLVNGYHLFILRNLGELINIYLYV